MLVQGLMMRRHAEEAAARKAEEVQQQKQQQMMMMVMVQALPPPPGMFLSPIDDIGYECRRAKNLSTHKAYFKSLGQNASPRRNGRGRTASSGDSAGSYGRRSGTGTRPAVEGSRVPFSPPMSRRVVAELKSLVRWHHSGIMANTHSRDEPLQPPGLLW